MFIEKKKTLFILFTATILALSGCAQNPPKRVIPQAISGSKSDGMVKLGYETSANSPATPDWKAAKAQALQRCKAWGYTNVEEFAGEETQCIEMGNGLLFNGAMPGQCAKQTIQKSFRCLN